MTFRSALAVSVSVSVAVLLLGLGSEIVAGAATAAELTRDPVAEALTVPVTKYVIEAPAVRLTV